MVWRDVNEVVVDSVIGFCEIFSVLIFLVLGICVLWVVRRIK